MSCLSQTETRSTRRLTSPLGASLLRMCLLAVPALVALSTSDRPTAQQPAAQAWIEPRVPRASDAQWAMAEDAARGRAVLVTPHGSHNPSRAHPIRGARLALYEWDGRQWHRIRRPSEPPLLERFSIAYDSHRRRTVLSGQAPGRAQTWEWDGDRWHDRTTTSDPTEYDAKLAYDPVSRQTLKFGPSSGRTWGWDGTRWIRRTPSASPPPRSHYAIALDPARNRIVLSGGSTSQTMLDDVWEWDGSTWTRAATRLPLPTRDHALISDPILGGVLLFGGRTPNGPSDQFLRWNGRTTTRLTGPGATLARLGHVAAFSRAHDQLVVFGSSPDSSSKRRTNDTLVWDRARWNLALPAPEAEAAATALNTRRNVLVRVQTDPNGQHQAWEWDGKTWRSAPSLPANSTSQIRDLAFDPSTNRIVALAVRGFTVATWAYDGSTWAQLQAPTTIAPSRGLIYDPVNRRLLALNYGGTWTWAGTQWQSIPGETMAQSSPLAFHTRRREVVMFDSLWGRRLLAFDGSRWNAFGPALPSSSRYRAIDLEYLPATDRVALYLADIVSNETQLWILDRGQWISPSTPEAQYRRPAATLVRGGKLQLMLGSQVYELGGAGVVEPFGRGCGGTSMPFLRADVPQFGRRARLSLHGGRPMASGAIFLAAGAGMSRAGPCTSYLSGATTAVPISTNAAGFGATAEFEVLGIPGQRVYGQGLLLDPTGPLGGLSATGGLGLVIGR